MRLTYCAAAVVVEHVCVYALPTLGTVVLPRTVALALFTL